MTGKLERTRHHRPKRRKQGKGNRHEKRRMIAQEPSLVAEKFLGFVETVVAGCSALELAGVADYVEVVANHPRVTYRANPLNLDPIKKPPHWGNT